MGRNKLLDYLKVWQEIGINHLAFNLKYGQRPALEVIEELAEYILPHFPTLNSDRPSLKNLDSTLQISPKESVAIIS